MKTTTLLLLVVLIAGCVPVAGCVGARHADENRDYHRNCGYAMEELGLCSALPRP